VGWTAEEPEPRSLVTAQAAVTLIFFSVLHSESSGSFSPVARAVPCGVRLCCVHTVSGPSSQEHALKAQ
jgi:hypothetical protein